MANNICYKPPPTDIISINYWVEYFNSIKAQSKFHVVKWQQKNIHVRCVLDVEL